MGKCVHTHLVIRGVDSHGLLAHSTLIGVSWRLVVIGEWDNRSADAKYHRWVNLAVRERHHLFPIAVQIRQTHGDHSGLLFLHVDELDETFGAARLEVPSATILFSSSVITGWSRALTCPRLLRLVKHHLDVPLADLQLVVFHDVQRPLDATCVRAELDLAFGEVSHNRYLPLNLAVSPQILKV